MLEKQITYDDFFSDEKITETFYFHLTRSELLELEVHFGGGIEAGIKRIIAAEDNETLVKEFKWLIMLAYGKKVGRSFDKSEEAKKEFASSPAFDELFMQLLGDEKFAAEFVNGIMPKGMPEGGTTATEAKAAMEKAAAEKAAPTKKLELPPQPPLPPSA